MHRSAHNQSTSAGPAPEAEGRSPGQGGAGDRIEVGEIECLEPEHRAHRPAERDHIGTWMQDASNRLIMVAMAALGVNGPASLDIEHGDDLEGLSGHACRH